MGSSQFRDEKNVVEYWRMLEWFSPQPVPKKNDSDVSQWTPGTALPWEQNRPLRHPGKVWSHQIYLGIYPLSASYEWLHHAFTDARDAFDERPPGESACAAMVIDKDGRLIPNSVLLSSALWAIGRIRSNYYRAPKWMEEFEAASTAFTDGIAEHFATPEGTPPRPIDHDALAWLVRFAHRTTDIDGVVTLASVTVRIRSIAIDANKSGTATDTDFLNSFYLDDLATVHGSLAAGNAGAALRAYLAPEGKLDITSRIDVTSAPPAERAMLAPARLPHGRWPSDPDHPLARSQQFAVNDALTELGTTTGVRGVNGPPGTGKSTLLRDILAGNVVERARRLARLRCASDAFGETAHRWRVGKYTMTVPSLKTELTGFEMVVASANNAAVENISVELPARKEIDSSYSTAHYFADIATALLNTDRNKGKSTGNDTTPTEAWGLVSAKLGNKSNRDEFVSAFWFGHKDGSSRAMQDTLAAWANGDAEVVPWPEACARFLALEKKVQRLLDERTDAQTRATTLTTLTRELAEHQNEVARLASLAETAAAVAHRHKAHLHALGAQSAQAEQRRTALLAVRPSWFENLMSLGRAASAWRLRLEPLNDSCAQLQQQSDQAQALWNNLSAAARDAAITLQDAQDRVAATAMQVDRLTLLCRRDRLHYGDAYPCEDVSSIEFHTRAPWLDKDLDAARSELFLAALQLHADWLANTAADSRKGLRAAISILRGDAPRGLDSAAVQAAWQLFFLVVPMISTTFASLGRLLGRLGPESLGWLVIDEAGQACPQYAVGAIWRARRVLAIGDPLQLQPVVTMPTKAQRDIAAAYAVTDTWIPPHASVQTLADRVSRYGTMVRRDDEEVWVSAPLRVHRRCDDPMFSLCNRLAYNNLMVSGVKRKVDDLDNPDIFDGPDGPLIAPSYWADTPAESPGSHLQERELERLAQAIDYLGEHGVTSSRIIAVSPFRAVANRLRSLAAEHGEMTGGTVHTAQGREADVVFLVLGGDPDSPGAKAWASESVNLINVAVSRAKRRLYVIGDRAAWSKYPYFRDLSKALR
ncbi:DEAD/DEAH box helicase [Rathayibacter toxicus]|uniref:DEAD/DEAH box helicase n=1 Tax=Rathayibacter toxicus TaxID=145458 RepID=UPI001C0443E0|nr:AAA domain-containing protein [Rathayibacter toxicus]